MKSPMTTNDALQAYPSMSPIPVFICCSDENRVELKTLEKHLAVLRSEIVVSHFANIPVGANRRNVQSERIGSARIAIVMLTSDLLASEECEDDLEMIWERAKQGHIQILPIRVRACELGSLPLRALEILPRDGSSIVESSNSEQAWVDVVATVRSFVHGLRGGRSSSKDASVGFAASGIRRSILIVAQSSFVEWGKVMQCYLGDQHTVTVRPDLRDGAHKTHDFTVLCIPPTEMEVGWMKIALQLVIEEDERRQGRIIVLHPSDNDNPFQGITDLKMIAYNAMVMREGERDKLSELQRCAMGIERVMMKLPPKNHIPLSTGRARSPSEVFASMRRLNAVIVDLRDVLISLPGKLGSLVMDPERFQQMRASIACDVRRIAEPFFSDAKNCGTTKEFQGLVDMTVEVITALPHFTEPLFEGQSKLEILERVLSLAFAEYSNNGAPLEAVENEVQRRIDKLVATYASWWKDGQFKLQRATSQLLDALRDASLSLNEALLNQPGMPR